MFFCEKQIKNPFKTNENRGRFVGSDKTGTDALSREMVREVFSECLPSDGDSP